MKAQHLKWLKKLLALLQTDLSQRFLEIVQQAQVQLISSKQQVKPLLKLRERLQNQSQIQIQLVSKLWLLQLLFSFF